MSKAILKIDLDEENNLHLIAEKSERFKNHGFGMFLSDIKKGEVKITKDALEELLKQKSRGGLQGMEFWDNKILAWGSTSLDFSVPGKCINLPLKAKIWVKELFEVC